MPVSNIRALFAPKNYFPQSLFPQSKQAKALTLLAISAMSYLAFDYLRARHWNNKVNSYHERVPIYTIRKTSSLNKITNNPSDQTYLSLQPKYSKTNPSVKTKFPCLISKNALDSVNNTMKLRNQALQVFCAAFNRTINEISQDEDNTKRSEEICALMSDDLEEKYLIELVALTIFKQNQTNWITSDNSSIRLFSSDLLQFFDLEKMDESLVKKIKVYLFHYLHQELAELYQEVINSIDTTKDPFIIDSHDITEDEKQNAEQFLTFLQNEGSKQKDSSHVTGLFAELLDSKAKDIHSQGLYDDLIMTIHFALTALKGKTEEFLDDSEESKPFLLLEIASPFLAAEFEKFIHFLKVPNISYEYSTIKASWQQRVYLARLAMREVYLTEPFKDIAEYTNLCDHSKRNLSLLICHLDKLANDKDTEIDFSIPSDKYLSKNYFIQAAKEFLEKRTSL